MSEVRLLKGSSLILKMTGSHRRVLSVGSAGKIWIAHEVQDELGSCVIVWLKDNKSLEVGTDME